MYVNNKLTLVNIVTDLLEFAWIEVVYLDGICLQKKYHATTDEFLRY